MNGALILGSHDGTNLEIANIVSEDDGMFLFGASEHDILNIREGTIDPNEVNTELKLVIEEIKAELFGPISDIIRDILT